MRWLFMSTMLLSVAVVASQVEAAKPRRTGHRVGPQEDLPVLAKSANRSPALVTRNKVRYQSNQFRGQKVGRFAFEDDDWCWTRPRVGRRPPPPPDPRVVARGFRAPR